MPALTRFAAALAALLPLAKAIDWELPSELLDDPLYGAPDNDFNCRSDEHPNPVIMLHGLSANREVDLNTLSHNLTEQGYCVFSETYGAHSFPDWIGGLAKMSDSAADIADFIRSVKDNTGAEKVDIVGHSEGGVMALYVPMTQDGIAEIVDHNIALGPAVHGAQYFGFTDLFYMGGDATRDLVNLALDTLGCPACDDMATGGDVYNEFQSAERIVQEGNKASIIMSNSDALVAPEYSAVEEEGVRNIYVQDSCPDDAVGHAGLAWDESVWGLVINELTEDYERPFVCGQGLTF